MGDCDSLALRRVVLQKLEVRPPLLTADTAFQERGEEKKDERMIFIR